MTVAGEQGWVINDQVAHLRVRGMRGDEHVHALPAAPADEVTIGSGDDATIRLVDPRGELSRRHAVLKREGEKWTAHDARSKNGIRLDGERRVTFDLAPGVELGVGSIEMIAESAHLIALRDLLDRWIGWSAPHHAEVDAALRAVRYMATRRAALVLRGQGDLAPLAERLHHQAIGTKRAFVVATSNSDGLAALHAASEGTLCIQATSLPADWLDVVKGLRAQTFHARAIVCAPASAEGDAAIVQVGGAMVVELPALASRGDEIERVIREYATEAAAELHVAGIKFRTADWERLTTWKWTGLSQVANDTRRLVALREWGVVDGAARLGVTHGALSRWAVRRRLATF